MGYGGCNRNSIITFDVAGCLMSVAVIAVIAAVSADSGGGTVHFKSENKAKVVINVGTEDGLGFSLYIKDSDRAASCEAAAEAIVIEGPNDHETLAGTQGGELYADWQRDNVPPLQKMS